jgi:SanA protein
VSQDHPQKQGRIARFLRSWWKRIVVTVASLALFVAAIYFLVGWTAQGRCYSNINEVPSRYLGVVLGCAKKIGRYQNEFFNTRVKAAAELYHAGKVQFLLVSGDNHRNGYDEPTDLKEALIKKGVPADHIYCDYAGLRTLDSIVRAHRVFGQSDFTIISQRFHNERALYIARRSGIRDVVAFNADDVMKDWMVKMYLREIPARIKAVLDVEVLKTKPKFLGKKVPVGPNTPPVDAQPIASATKGK